MFGMVSGLLLEPLPFRDADQLVTVTSRQPQGGVNRGGLSFLDFADDQEQAPTFAAMAGVESRSLTFSDTDEPERVLGAAVSWRLFSMLGIAPARGRDFAAADDRAGAPAVVLLSDELWRWRYNADPAIVGRPLSINAQPYTVIGVLPPRVKFPFLQVAWIPLAPLSQAGGRQARDLEVFARVAPGRSSGEARQELEGVAARLATLHAENVGWSVRLDPLAEYYIPGEVRLVTLTAMGSNVASTPPWRAARLARWASVTCWCPVRRASAGAGWSSSRTSSGQKACPRARSWRGAPRPPPRRYRIGYGTLVRRDADEARLGDGTRGPLIGGASCEPGMGRGVMHVIRPGQRDEHVHVEQRGHGLLVTQGAPHVPGRDGCGVFGHAERGEACGECQGTRHQPAPSQGRHGFTDREPLGFRDGSRRVEHVIVELEGGPHEAIVPVASCDVQMR